MYATSFFGVASLRRHSDSRPSLQYSTQIAAQSDTLRNTDRDPNIAVVVIFTQ